MANHHRTVRNLVSLLLAGLILGGCAAPEKGVKLAEPPAPAPPSPSPRELFLTKCSLCHEAAKGYAVVGRRDGWADLAAAMATKDPAWINPAQVKTIVAYADLHPAVASDLFSRKCGTCHQWGGLRELDKSASQWKTMIRFMGERCDPLLSGDEAEIIYRALTDRGPSGTGKGKR